MIVFPANTKQPTKTKKKKSKKKKETASSVVFNPRQRCESFGELASRFEIR